MHLLFPFILLMWCSLSVRAQQQPPQRAEELVTDRPDQTESAQLVPKGLFQLETGYCLHWRDPKERDVVYNSSLLRIGVFGLAELRLSQALLTREHWQENSLHASTGFGPLTLGSKLALWQEKGVRPTAALLAEYTLPTGKGALREEEEVGRYLVLGLFSHTLPAGFALGYNLGGGFWGKNRHLLRYTLALNRTFANKLCAFVELYGEKEGGEKASLLSSAGITYLLSHNLQLDVSLSKGVSAGADRGYVSSGLSWRFPR